MSYRGRHNHASNDSYHSFLESLKGKNIKIYRGGPESKQGVLLDVQSDYIAVNTQNNNNKNQNNNTENNGNENNNNNNNVIYYHTQHIKSISEDTKSNSSQVTQASDTEVEFIQAPQFTEVVDQFKEKNIQINQGGPESKKGLVLDIVDDYIVLFTEDDGVVYFNVHHIKSICEYNQNNQNDENSEDTQDVQLSIPSYEIANNFHDLFEHMSHKWVSINRGGPEAMEGVLVTGSGGHYTLVSNEEVLRINPFHIRSISAGSKGALKQNNNNNQAQNNQDQNVNEEGIELNENHMEDMADHMTSHRSSRRSSRDHSRETVVKTIDYRWKPNV